MKKSMISLLWVIAGAAAGLIGFTLVVGATVVNDDDMHSWIFYTALVGPILGGATASVIVSHLHRNYKMASAKCFVMAAINAYWHFGMFREVHEGLGHAEAVREVGPALVWGSLLFLYGLLLIGKAYNRES
jgi:phosphate/sulfate permease